MDQRTKAEVFCQPDKAVPPAWRPRVGTQRLPAELQGMARIAALTARFSLPLVTGHRKYEAISDGDLRSLLADIEELIAGEA